MEWEIRVQVILQVLHTFCEHVSEIYIFMDEAFFVLKNKTMILGLLSLRAGLSGFPHY